MQGEPLVTQTGKADDFILSLPVSLVFKFKSCGPFCNVNFLVKILCLQTIEEHKLQRLLENINGGSYVLSA